MYISATDPMFQPQIFKDYTQTILNFPGEDLQSATVHVIYPLLIQANVSIAVLTIHGNFALTFIPQIVLWNTYRVDLHTANDRIELCAPYTDPTQLV
jgi:hypothetical protein